MATELGTPYQWGLSSGVLGRGQVCSWELPTAEGVAFGSEDRGADRQVPVSHVLRTGGAGTPSVNHSHTTCGVFCVWPNAGPGAPFSFAHTLPSKSLASVSRKETHGRK